MEATIVLINMANVPWSEKIHEIANSALDYSHPLVEKLKQKIKNEPINAILRKPKYKLIKQNEISSLDDVSLMILFDFYLKIMFYNLLF